MSQALHKIMPHFAERDEKTNAFRQQDAHECWSAVISNLAQTLKVDTPQTQEVFNSVHIYVYTFTDTPKLLYMEC